MAANPLPLVLGLLALGVALLFWLDARARNSPAARTEARLAAMLARGAGGRAERPGTAATADADLFNTRRRGVGGAVKGWLSDLSETIGGRAALRLLFGVAAVAGLAAWAFAARGGGLGGLSAAGVGLLAGLAVFHIFRGELQRRWMIGFLDMLVEAVELLTRSVRAGYAVPAAIRMVGKEIEAPVGPVFARIADEDDLGIELRTALRNAARRVNLPDFTFLAIAMVIQRETGGQIGDSLDNLHMVLRKRKEARLKTRALTAEGRMSATIVGAIPFVAGIAVYFLNPEQTMLLFEPGLGQTMMLVAVGLLSLGFVVIRWIVTARP